VAGTRLKENINPDTLEPLSGHGSEPCEGCGSFAECFFKLELLRKQETSYEARIEPFQARKNSSFVLAPFTKSQRSR
jgi:hypothetical protein